MKRTIYGLFIALLCFLSITALAQNKNFLVSINNMEVQPGPLATRLILNSDSPLPVEKSFYSLGLPPTIVVDMENVTPAEALRAPAADPQLIEDVKVERLEGARVRLFIRLKEKVPYRIFSDRGRTVVELTKIQRGQAEYTIDPEIQKLLDRASSERLVLESMDITELPDRVTFRANLTGKPIAQAFALTNPSRLVVDVFDTVYANRSSVYPVEKMGVDKLRLGQFADDPRPITRLVFDLRESGLYSLRSGSGELDITFFRSPAAPGAETKSVPGTPPAPESGVKKADAPAPKADKPRLQETPRKAAEQKPPDQPVTAAAAAPANPAPSKAGEAKLQADPQEEKYKPKTLSAEEEKYSGDIISLKFKDADLRDVVLYLAEFANLNVVFDPDVRGIVTCNLEDVPWDQALDIVLKQNKMGKTIEGNVLRIAPIGVLTREDDDQRKLKESKEMAGPVQVKTITLSYSKAKDVQGLLRSKISNRGELIVDERTNTLIISDVKDRLDLLEKLITVLDTPTPQVSIEARIIEATATFIRNLGIQWGFRGISDPFYGNQTSLVFPNKIAVDGAMIPVGTVTKGIGGPLGGYAINLPAPAFQEVIGFSFANILDTFRLDVALSALESSGNGRIISSPKVTTQNNQPAEIVQGRQIPVQTVANFTVTTRYVNAALELKATPQITAEGTIIMTVEIQNNAADFANLVNGIPPITTQSAKTTVMIPDGGTTVIGGIYRTEDSITRERVPFLHQIPILGNLFRNFARTKSNRELLIFITPRIIK